MTQFFVKLHSIYTKSQANCVINSSCMTVAPDNDSRGNENPG